MLVVILMLMMMALIVIIVISVQSGSFCSVGWRNGVAFDVANFTVRLVVLLLVGVDPGAGRRVTCYVWRLWLAESLGKLGSIVGRVVVVVE